MGKDPAFLFYPGDWLGGTIGMTFEEKGAYMELLMMQFNRGHMTSHMIRQVVGENWVKLQDKFVQDENGLWYNVRLDQEKEKRKAYVKTRKNNLLGDKHKNNPHMEPHMENENEDVNEIENKNKGVDFSKPDIEGDALVFPVDTQAIRGLWAKWKEHRLNNHNQRYRMMGEQADLKRLGMCEDEIQETILAAISNNWKNLYPDKTQKSKSKSNGHSNEHPAEAAARAFAKRVGKPA